MADLKKSKRETDSVRENQEPYVRLNKYLSAAGICSRREADRLAGAGRITVDGQTAKVGQKVLPTQKICVDGKVAGGKEDPVILALNKPRGIVCTTSKKEPDNIIDFVNYPKRIYPVGRLDKDSEGLILLTNDGALMDEILRARHFHEREYEVEVNRPVTNLFLKKMASGVPILDTVTRPCKVRRTGERSFRIILTQGLNRQIRRMCRTLDYRVVHLKRVRIMNITLGSLPSGTYRELTAREKEQLAALTRRA